MEKVVLAGSRPVLEVTSGSFDPLPALIGVVDNGIDIFHRSFQTADGKCRVVAFWDQKHQQEHSPAVPC